jgi:hypothetical protein
MARMILDAAHLVLGRTAVIGLLLAGAGAPAAAEGAMPPWVSLSGSGLMTLPDTSTLERGRYNIAFTFDNQDRDPLKLDVLDLSAAWVIGLRPGLETYGHAVVSRAVAVSPRATLFPSPIDILVPRGLPVPQRPYYPMYTPIPYVNRTGRSQLGRFLPGDAVAGVKKTFRLPSGKRPGLAASAEIKVPLAWGLADLQSGAGTGTIDERARITAEWGDVTRSVVTSLVYTHRGTPGWGDRVIVFDPSGVQVTDEPLRLANEVGLGLGLRQVVRSRVALVAEVTRVAEVGGHTRAVRGPGPLDIAAGAQLRWRSALVTAGLRYHANSVPRMTRYAWPLGGLADLSQVADADLVPYLSAIGASGAFPFLRHRGQSALELPGAGPPLPDGARILPADLTVRAHDQIGYMLVCGWTFGKVSRR